MEQRWLGRTGVSVSNLCLGAMMFGDWGAKDHDESIRIIHRALDAGINFVDTADVRYIGHSTFPASAIVEAQWIAKDRGRERFVTEQPSYSILTRAIESDILPTCQRYGMGVLSYSPLGGGWLSGRCRKDAEPTGPTSASRRRLVNRFDEIVPPGGTLNPADNGWVAPALEASARRR